MPIEVCIATTPFVSEEWHFPCGEITLSAERGPSVLVLSNAEDISMHMLREWRVKSWFLLLY